MQHVCCAGYATYLFCVFWICGLSVAPDLRVLDMRPVCCAGYATYLFCVVLDVFSFRPDIPRLSDMQRERASSSLDVKFSLVQSGRHRGFTLYGDEETGRAVSFWTTVPRSGGSSPVSSFPFWNFFFNHSVHGGSRVYVTPDMQKSFRFSNFY